MKNEIKNMEDTLNFLNKDGEYVEYRCNEHGKYLIRKILPEEEHKCPYCGNKK